MNKSYAFLIGLAVLIFILFGIYFPILSKYQDLRQQEQDLDTKIKFLDQRVKQLTDERDLLKNDRDYLEKVIRQELGLVRPGEIVYKFVSDPVDSASNAVPNQGTGDPAALGGVALVDLKGTATKAVSGETAKPASEAAKTPAPVPAKAA